MAAVKKIIPDLKYHRRHPESGLLFRVVETYWPLFLREQERVGRNIPDRKSLLFVLASENVICYYS